MHTSARKKNGTINAVSSVMLHGKEANIDAFFTDLWEDFLLVRDMSASFSFLNIILFCLRKYMDEKGIRIHLLTGTHNTF